MHCFKITSIDEEAGIGRNGYDKAAISRYSDLTIKQSSAVFAWGNEDTDTLKKIYFKHSNKIHKTGSPRVDLWKSFFSDYVLYLNGDYLFRPENLINDIIIQICSSGFDAIIPSYKNFNTNFIFDKDSMTYKIFGKELKNRSEKEPFFSSLYGLGSIVKTKIASQGLLVSEKKNGLYNIRSKIQSLRITDIDQKILKEII